MRQSSVGCPSNMYLSTPLPEHPRRSSLDQYVACHVRTTESGGDGGDLLMGQVSDAVEGILALHALLPQNDYIAAVGSRGWR